MSFNPPSPGNADVASYMISGLPWVSSSAITSGSIWRIDFPYVTSEITVHQASATPASLLAIGFTANGVNGVISGTVDGPISGNRFVLSNAANTGEFLQIRCRVKTIFLKALTSNVSASVCASLTTIIPNRFPVLTGSTALAVSGSPDYLFTGAQGFFGYDGLG